MPRFSLRSAALLCLCALPLGPAFADKIYFSDHNGKLGYLDTDAREVSVVGDMPDVMTDLAFSSTGQLYGVSFSKLYSIDAATGAATLIGDHGVPGANALIAGPQDILISASFNRTGVYAIDPANASSQELGDIGTRSGGDLVVVPSGLLLANNAAEIYHIDTDDKGATKLFSTGLTNLYGLATTSQGQLVGAAGTKLYEINTETGAPTEVLDLSAGFEQLWGLAVMPALASN
ncbi:MAG: hypothetical protein ACPGNV_10225 [Mangrovicoccus sp.]